LLCVLQEYEICPWDPQPWEAGGLINFDDPSCPSGKTNTLPQVGAADGQTDVRTR
jgi:hypothetical protein